MNSFDDIFEGHISQRGQTNQPFDKEAWAEKKQAERQSVYDLADTTAVEVSADGSKFQSYLDVQTRFSHQRSSDFGAEAGGNTVERLQRLERSRCIH